MTELAQGETQSSTSEAHKGVVDILAGLGGENPAQPEQLPESTEGESVGAAEVPVETETAGAEGAEQGETGGDGEETPLEWETTSVASLAELIEVDPADLYKIQVPVGDGKSLPLGQLKDSLQKVELLEAQQNRLEAERATLQREREEWNRQAADGRNQFLQLPQEAMHAKAQMAALEQAWEYLDKNSEGMEAGQLALKRQELQTAYGSAQQQLGTAMQKMQQQMAEERRQTVQKEAVQLIGKIPEWRDMAVAKQGKESIGLMMGEYGFEAGAVDQIIDHRVLLMLKDLAEMKGKLAKAEAALSKGARLPRVIRPGAAKSAAQVNKDKLKERMKLAAESKNLRLKGAVIGQMLSGGT